ncbi:MAG: exo-alpha-sialidase, partial [Thermoleophilia bacterium]|nr:exo-alpha-sialidase [Thermoleophilia bacterium]
MAAPVAGDAVTVAVTATAAGTPSVTSRGDRVWLTWGEYDEATQLADAFLASSTDGGRSFGPPRNITGHGGVEGPRTVSAADGTLFMSVLEWAAKPLVADFYPAWAQVYRSTDAGETWQRLGRAPGPSEMKVDPTQISLAVSDDGERVLVTWYDATPADHIPEGVPVAVEGTMSWPGWASVSMDGGRTFSAPRPAIPSACGCCSLEPFFRGDTPSIAFRAVTPIDSEKDERDVAITEYGADGRWQTAVEVRDDRFTIPLAGCPSSGPGVAPSGHDTAVAWWTGAEGRTGFWFARSATPGSGEPTKILSSATQIGDVEMAETPDGRHLVLVSTVDEVADEGHDRAGDDAPETTRRLRVFSVGEAIAELPDADVEIPSEFEPWYS